MTDKIDLKTAMRKLKLDKKSFFVFKPPYHPWHIIKQREDKKIHSVCGIEIETCNLIFVSNETPLTSHCPETIQSIPELKHLCGECLILEFFRLKDQL